MHGYPVGIVGVFSPIMVQGLSVELNPPFWGKSSIHMTTFLTIHTVISTGMHLQKCRQIQLARNQYFIMWVLHSMLVTLSTAHILLYVMHRAANSGSKVSNSGSSRAHFILKYCVLYWEMGFVKLFRIDDLDHYGMLSTNMIYNFLVRVVKNGIFSRRICRSAVSYFYAWYC